MSVETAPDRYRRRRRWPILVVVLLLAVGTTVLWFQIVKPPAAAATGCNQPGPAPSSTAKTTRSNPSGGSGSSGATASSGGSPRSSAGARTTRASASGTPAASPSASPTPSVTTRLGSFTSPSMLAATRPADPSGIDLRVVNASRTRGQAATLTQDLQSAGFDSIADPANDPLYPAQDLVCAQEIRFGPAGLAQARTVLIAAPCAQLVMDNRFDQSVDLALGANYAFVATPAAARAQLAAIHDAAAPVAVIEGQTAAPRPLASIPPLPQATCSSSGAVLSSG